MAKPPPDDYYALLEVAASASDDELRRAWKKLALQWHPDRAGDDAKATFQRIAAAYAVLSDPRARVAYDRWRSPAPSEAVAKPEPPPRRAPGVLLSRLSGPIDVLIGIGVARRAEGDVIDLFVDDYEATHGGMVTVAMRVPVRAGTEIVEDLFSAWLAIRPGVADGTILTPSAWLPGMLKPVYFRVRLPVTPASTG